MTYYHDPRQDPRYQQPQPAPGIDFGAIARTIGAVGLAGFAGHQIGRAARMRPEVAEAEAMRAANMARQSRQQAPARETHPQPAPQVQVERVQPQGMNTNATVDLSQAAAPAANRTISREEWLAKRAAAATPQVQVQAPSMPAPQVQVQRVAEQPAVAMRSADPAQAVNTLAVTGRGRQGMDTSPTVRVQRVDPNYLEQRNARQDFPMKGSPAVEMQYGRVEGQGLPIAMEKQGSFYTAQQMGQGRSKPISTDQLLHDYENAMDSFSGSANDRLMRGNRYNGFEVVNPTGVDHMPYLPSATPQRWIDSDDAIATARFTKEGIAAPLTSNNSQNINKPVPISYDLLPAVVPAWEKGNLTSEYLQPIPQRLSDAIDQNVMATRPSVDVTEQIINSGGNISPSVARTVAQVKAPVYSTAEMPSAYQRPEQTPTQGSYSMQTFEDPAVFNAYENNFAQSGKEIMLPSSVIKDRVVVQPVANRQGTGGILAPIQSEPVLSPYPLSLGSTYAKSDLTAPSSMKADLGNDDRLAWMLRSDQQPDLPEYGDRSPDYVKYVPQTQTVGGQYQETMTDAHDVRRRIAATANNLGASAKIAEQSANRTAYPRNAYGVQVDQTMRPMGGAFENPNLMTPQQMKAAVLRQNANEMQHRLTFTDDAIAEAYERLDAKAGQGMDTQQVLVSRTGADGTTQNQMHNLSLEDQLQMGAELQRQGYARDINHVPAGYSVSYGEDYPEWERKYQRGSNPRVFGSSAPVVVVPEDQTGWGRAVQLR